MFLALKNLTELRFRCIIKVVKLDDNFELFTVYKETEMANENEKRVFVYRHGPKASGPSKTGGANLGVPLTQEGEEMMLRAAKRHISQYFEPVAVYCSPAVRTYQTAMFFSQASGRNFPLVENCLIGRHEAWDSFNVGSNPTAKDFYRDKPVFIKEEALLILLSIKRIIRGLIPGEDVVCVSHGGLIEPTVALANAEIQKRDSQDIEDLIPEDLKEGEAAVFVFDEENNLVEARKS